LIGRSILRYSQLPALNKSAAEGSPSAATGIN